MLEDDEHVYYWAWAMEDNPNYNMYRANDLKYRVFRGRRQGVGIPVTEPMSKREAVAKCKQIVMLTEGREIE